MPAQTPTISPDESKHNVEQDEWKEALPKSRVVEERLREQIGRIVALCREGTESLFTFEAALVPLVFTLGRLAVALFLCLRHEELEVQPSEVHGDRWYERSQAQPRLMGTHFGKVRYWRTYMRARSGGQGYYPLDVALRLPVNGFSTHVVGLMTRLATKMSYTQAELVFHCALGWSPSTTSLEHAVLGLGRHTTAWFERVPAPAGDGEVLIIEIDGKCPPTATDDELEKRRQKRRPPLVSDSPRHRGRARRRERGPKQRKKKGDKTKNGKMTTVVVMYSLTHGRDRDGNHVLKGPINKQVYASFASKRHAFARARREADKRGFQCGSGKVVQIVTDGDNNYVDYVKDFFPEAIHTLDVIHATEYIWKAGRSLHREGSKALQKWADEQRHRLYDGEVEGVLADLRAALAAIPKTGPGNKGKRTRLQDTINYFAKRIPMMNYKDLIEQDLEIATGAVEGAVRYVVSQRFDSGGMRWIKERAEPLLQLRCIELNGHWDKFLCFVHDRETGPPDDPLSRLSLRATTPAPLPSLGVAA